MSSLRNLVMVKGPPCLKRATNLRSGPKSRYWPSRCRLSLVNLFIVTIISEPLLEGNAFFASAKLFAVACHLALTLLYPLDVPFQELIAIGAPVCQSLDNGVHVADLAIGEVFVVGVQDVEELLCFIHCVKYIGTVNRWQVLLLP